MKKIRLYGLGLVLASMTLLMTACSGGSSTPVALPNPNVAVTTNYQVEYVPGTPASPTMGKTTFQLRVTKLSDGTPADGLNISLAPMMYMVTGMGTMTHSTPVDVVHESSTLGTYDCAVYYIMPSSDMDTWVLDAIVAGETATFSPTVGGMISIPKLYGQSPDDLITNATGSEPRTYFLLKDGPTTTTSISLFIAAQENMKMHFSALYTGATLTTELDNPWSISTVAVEATTEPEDSGSWVPGIKTNALEDGHWTLPILPNLSSGGTGTVYVRLLVDDVQKSTDKKLVSSPTSTYGYQTFVVREGI
jgi:hypothetical protein